MTIAAPSAFDEVDLGACAPRQGRPSFSTQSAGSRLPLATGAATAPDYRSQRPARTTALQRERSVGGGRQVGLSTSIGTIELRSQLRAPTSGIPGVSDSTQVGALSCSRARPPNTHGQRVRTRPPQISVCSEISRASSPSMPRFLSSHFPHGRSTDLFCFISEVHLPPSSTALCHRIL
jgi:hypothetical protein